jgi:hypothetical protein
MGIDHFLDALAPAALRIRNCDKSDIFLRKDCAQAIRTSRAETYASEYDLFAGGNSAQAQYA